MLCEPHVKRLRCITVSYGLTGFISFFLQYICSSLSPPSLYKNVFLLCLYPLNCKVLTILACIFVKFDTREVFSHMFTAFLHFLCKETMSDKILVKLEFFCILWNESGGVALKNFVLVKPCTEKIVPFWLRVSLIGDVLLWLTGRAMVNECKCQNPQPLLWNYLLNLRLSTAAKSMTLMRAFGNYGLFSLQLLRFWLSLSHCISQSSCASLLSTVFWPRCFLLLFAVISGRKTCGLQISLRESTEMVPAGKSLD